MKFKKVLILITAFSMLTAALTACSTDSTVESANSDNDASITQDSESDTSADEQTEETSADGEAETDENGETVEATDDSSDSSSSGTTAKSSSSSKTTTAKSSNTTAKSSSASSSQKKSSSSSSKTTTSATSTTEADTTISINLTKNGGAECSSSNVTIEAATLSDPQGTVYIEAPGDYVITSSTDTWHGQIIIKLANTQSASVRFENVNITTTRANVVKIIDTSISAERSFIEAEASSSSSSGDTDNDLRDEMKEVSKQDKAPNVSLSFPTSTSSSFTTSANALSGVIYNESKLTIKGNGSVNISATTNRNNAICSTKSVTFKNVTATLTTAANTSTSALSSARGIFTFSKVYVESGSLNIKSNGDGIRCEEFNSSGGTTTITSSACDGVDADDAINITGGTVTVKGLKKSCFKVRRINNQEDIKAGDTTIKASDGVTKSTHTFRIDGGTVIAEGKNITTVQEASTQASITCRSVKASGSSEAKVAISFTIKGSGVNVTSSDKCIKYLYSSSAIDSSKDYTVSSSGYTSVKASFKSKVGDARIVATS